MKKYWLIALMIVGVAATAATVRIVCTPTPSPQQWLTRELKLTPDQQSRWAEMQKDLDAKLDASCADMCAARFALADELKSGASFSPHAEQMLAKLQVSQAASQRETMVQFFRVKSILTPEQQHRYAELISGKLCADCPRRVHQNTCLPQHADHHP